MISGFAASFFLPAFHAGFPMFVAKGQLDRAAGRAQLTSALVPIISAPLAGVLVTAWGLGVIFLMDFITFWANILLLTIVFIPQPATSSDSESGSFLADFGLGLRYIMVRKPFRYLISLIAGPLASDVFEPLLIEGGALSDSVGILLGTGQGRGIGLMYVGGGLVLLCIALIATLTPHIRLLEDKLPNYASNDRQSGVQHTATAPQTDGDQSDNVTTSAAESTSSSASYDRAHCPW